MKSYTLPILFIYTCCLSFGEDTGYKESLKIAEGSIKNIDVSKGENHDFLDETLKLFDKDPDSSEATYKVTRIQYKAALQSLLIEVDQIESEEISNQEKAKKLLILLKKGELLLKYQSESKAKYIRGLLLHHPSNPR